MLRKQQEENPLPYELGAWEAFSQKRAAIARKKTAYWISGIAASLALLLVVGGVWFTKSIDTGKTLPSEQLASQENSSGAPSESAAREKTKDPEKEFLALSEEKTKEESKSQSSDFPKKRTPATEMDVPVSPEKPVSESIQEFIPEMPTKIETSSQATNIEKSKGGENPTKSVFTQALIANQEKPTQTIDLQKQEGLKEEVVIGPVLPKEPQMTEEEIQEILETPSFARLALGLSPGFGASQSSSLATSGSSLGFGVMVDMDIAGKLVMGSGLAVNYLNQASEGQSYAQVAGFSSPVTEKNEIAQVQVDIPLFFKYPITSNQSISVQAGFSNLVTFNQTAQNEVSYTRQIAVLNANSASPSNEFTLRSEFVDQASALAVPQNRFYPFATANLGVNFRLFESKKTSYEVMPFYNYPLQEFSGYGEKLGMFGASFKVNFLSIQRK